MLAEVCRPAWHPRDQGRMVTPTPSDDRVAPQGRVAHTVATREPGATSGGSRPDPVAWDPSRERSAIQAMRIAGARPRLAAGSLPSPAPARRDPQIETELMESPRHVPESDTPL